ncbi:unnamed protein product, partial [Ectocarpus fasciculatus]
GTRARVDVARSKLSLCPTWVKSTSRRSLQRSGLEAARQLCALFREPTSSGSGSGRRRLAAGSGFVVVGSAVCLFAPRRRTRARVLEGLHRVRHSTASKGKWETEGGAVKRRRLLFLGRQYEEVGTATAAARHVGVSRSGS